MHQCDLGILVHVKSILDEKLSSRQCSILNSRLKELERWPALRLPVTHGYFGSVSHITAAEHRAMFEVIIAVSWGKDIGGEDDTIDIISLDEVKLLRATVDWLKLIRERQYTRIDLHDLREAACT